MSLDSAGYPCDRCFKVFPTLAEVFSHCRTCRANPKLTCRDCSATFSQSGNLKRHQLTCKAAYTIPCKHEWCTSKFKTKEAMEFHASFCVELPCHAECTRPAVLTCGKPWCTRVFDTEPGRKLHERACKSPADVAASMVCSTCTKCHKTFSTAAYAQHHQSRCQGLKTKASSTCTKCHKTFSTAAYAQQHQSRCQGPKTETSRTCSKCNMDFSSACYMRQHERTCQGPKTKASRTCSKCNMEFSSACYMRQHELTCGITYECSRKCGQSFNRPSKRARHEESCTHVAPPDFKYWCPVCPWTGFVTREEYDAHAQRGMHKPPLYIDSPNEPLPPADRPLVLDRALVAREMVARNMPVPECMEKYL